MLLFVLNSGASHFFFLVSLGISSIFPKVDSHFTSLFVFSNEFGCYTEYVQNIFLQLEVCRKLSFLCEVNTFCISNASVIRLELCCNRNAVMVIHTVIFDIM
jgi:hypothetical protein